MELFKSGVDLSKMVYVDAGEFIFGCAEESQWADSKIKSQIIHTSGYWIDKYPVTFNEYINFCDQSGYNLPNIDRIRMQWPSYSGSLIWGDESEILKSLECPVMLISWFDALAYCSWSGKTLPTEIQWEKAARGAYGQVFPWGDSLDIRKFCNGLSHVGDDIKLSLTMVDQFEEYLSPYNCADMMGNVAEYCLNLYHDPFGLLDINQRYVNYEYGVEGNAETKRTCGICIKGGGRESVIEHVSQRDPFDPWCSSPYVGFRCVWNPEENWS